MKFQEASEKFQEASFQRQVQGIINIRNYLRNYLFRRFIKRLY